MAEFSGFSSEGLRFYEDVRFNNNKPWFEENRDAFKKNVQIPAQQFVNALGERLRTVVPDIQFDTRLNGSGSIMRPYRDTRFSKDKTPYKTNLGIAWWEGQGKKTEVPGFYFHLDAETAWMGGGLYYFPKDVLDRFRRAVDNETLGSGLETAIAEVEATGFTVNGEKYKKVPRGYDKEHPRGELLKYKGMTTGSGDIPVEVLKSSELVDVCFEHCLKILPLQQWLVQMMAFGEEV